MEVVDIIFDANTDDYNESDLLHMIMLVESNSEHPIGKSISEQLKAKLTDNNFVNSASSILDFKAIPGSGVEANVKYNQEIHPIVIGNLELIENKSSTISLTQREIISNQQSLGYTVVAVSIDNIVRCVISLADKIRPEAKSVILALRNMGIESCMVTGDCAKNARIIASQCSISEIYAGVSPAGKRAIIINFQADGIKVAMVGDGVNDSASLAQSDFGIAVYGGTDVAIESASVVLMKADLADVVSAIDLSRTIYKRICFNFMFASGYNVLMIPLAMGVGAAWGNFQFNIIGIAVPAMASGIAMSFSSVSVLFSSLMLQYYKKPAINENGDISRESIWNSILVNKKEDDMLSRYSISSRDEEGQNHLADSSSLSTLVGITQPSTHQYLPVSLQNHML